MKHFNKILIPYDFSDYADQAVHFGIKVGDYDSEITILCVVEQYYYASPEGMTYFDQDFQARSKEILEKYVEKIQAMYSKHTIKYVLIQDNNPTNVIIDYQHEHKSDLIVIGSHGRRGINRVLMGSVAESIFREASCPVLIIKSKYNTQD